MRLAANHAVDRRALSDAETLGASRPTGSMVPRTVDFALALPPYAYDPAKAKQEAALMLIDPYPWSAPLEDVRLKAR